MPALAIHLHSASSLHWAWLICGRLQPCKGHHLRDIEGSPWSISMRFLIQTGCTTLLCAAPRRRSHSNGLNGARLEGCTGCCLYEREAASHHVSSSLGMVSRTVRSTHHKTHPGSLLLDLQLLNVTLPCASMTPDTETHPQLL